MMSRLPLKPDECVASYAARVAAENGFASLYEFHSVTGIVIPQLRAGDQNAINLLANWQGVEPKDLLRFTLPQGSLVDFGQSRLCRSQFRFNSVRYCPTCLRSDLDTGAGKPKTRPYLRGRWAWMGIDTCHVHRSKLQETTLVNAFQVGLEGLANCDDLGLDANQHQLACDGYFASRIDGNPEGSFLDTLPTYVAAELCGVLGGFLESRDRGAVNRLITGGKMAPLARSMGYDIARHGREAIDQFLADCVKSSIMRVPVWKKNYSPALNWLQSKTDDPDYESVVELFQTHAENHVPMDSGEIFLNVVKERKVHSVDSAAVEYGISEARIETVIQELNASLYGGGCTYFSASALHERLTEEASHLLVPEAADFLGTTVRQLDRLLTAGILSFKVQNSSSERVFRRVRRLDLDDLKVRLFSTVKPHVDDPEMVSVAAACRLCICNLLDIVEMILAGKLATLMMRGTSTRLDHLLVKVDEVKAVMASIQQKPADYLAIRELERALKTTTATVDELIKRNFLIPVILPNHKTKVPQVYVPRQVVDKFLMENVSLSTLSKEFGIHPRLLRNSLEMNGVFPIFEPHGKIARFYRKTDIEAARI